MRISTLTCLGRELNAKAASGRYPITCREVLHAIACGTIFELLDALFGEELPVTLALAVVDTDALLVEWQSCANAHGALDIAESSGLALLVAYILLSLHRTDFLIDDEQRQALQRIQACEGVPEAEQIRQALDEWLERRSPVPSDPAV